MEYATRMNPAINDTVPQSAMKNGANRFHLHQEQISHRRDFHCRMERYPERASWSTSGVTQSLVPDSDNGVTQQWKAVMPAGANGGRFVRLRVTRP